MLARAANPPDVWTSPEDEAEREIQCQGRREVEILRYLGKGRDKLKILIKLVDPEDEEQLIITHLFFGSFQS